MSEVMDLSSRPSVRKKLLYSAEVVNSALLHPALMMDREGRI